MIGGMYAGQVVAQAIKEDCSKKFLKLYDKMVREELDYESKGYKEVQDYIYSLSDEELNELGHALQEESFDEISANEVLKKIKQKSQQEYVEFVKISKFFPSTQICHKCQKRNENIKGLKNLGIRDWDCPHCHTHHDRDRNAAINILNKGLEIVGTTMQ